MRTIPRRAFALLVATSVFFCNCSRYYERSIEGDAIYERINRSAIGHDCEIATIDGKSTVGSKLVIQGHTVSWEDSDTNSKVLMDVSSIVEIRIQKRNTVYGGFILGSMAAVFMIGAGIAWENPAQGILVSPLAFIAGFMPGLLIGSLYTRDESFRINDEIPDTDN